MFLRAIRLGRSHSLPKLRASFTRQQFLVHVDFAHPARPPKMLDLGPLSSRAGGYVDPTGPPYFPEGLQKTILSIFRPKSTTNTILPFQVAILKFKTTPS
jgi:hypothetical protein